MKTFILILLLTIDIIYSITIVGRVTRVKDGDTIVIDTLTELVTIRLAEIDTPESKQSYGLAATEFTKAFCLGLIVSADIKTTDRYGRAIALVSKANGKSLQEALLKAGMAWHYKQYSYNTYYSILQQVACKESKGLWSEDNPVAPWQYRKNKR